MIYKGHREMGLVLAPNFFSKKTSPGPQVALNSNLPYLVDTDHPNYSKGTGTVKNCHYSPDFPLSDSFMSL